MAVPSTTVSGVVNIIGTSTSQTVALPGTPTVAVVRNIGSYPAFVLIGSSVTLATGVAIPPGGEFAFTVTTGSNISVIGPGSLLNVAVGS